MTNSAVIYGPPSKWPIVAAAVMIHLCAVALASHRPRHQLKHRPSSLAKSSEWRIPSRLRQRRKSQNFPYRYLRRIHPIPNLSN
jgi:hypothetical protein